MEKFEREKLEQLGFFTQKLKGEVLEIVQEGISFIKIIDFVEKNIIENGYIPAFPCTIAVNEIAAHFTVFDEDYVLRKGDLVKIDFGVCHNGYITDTAFSVEIGTNKFEKLLKANKMALDKALEIIDIDVTLSQIGDEVEKIALSHGFNTIHNLCGHQITRYNLHGGFNIPNYKNLDMRKIQIDSEFAIEPFFTTGEPAIKSAGLSNILHLVNDKPVRDPIAKKLLIHIRENYPKLPFSKRWLLERFEKNKLIYAINVLKKEGIIHEYSTLVSVDGNYISQFEDTVLFDGNEKLIITRGLKK